MLMPKRTKYRKQQKELGRINSRQIEAGRVALTRTMKRTGKVGVRMGKGKGSVEEWVMNIKPGRIIFEITGVDNETALRALKLAAAKLPFKTKIVTMENENELY